MAIIPYYFINSVVAIGIVHPDGCKLWIGTGFIVGRREKDNPNISTHYIITNKHVVANHQHIIVRFNSLGDTFTKDYGINLYDTNQRPLFSVHPNDGTDVIALQIAPQALIDDKSIWSSFDLIRDTLTLEQMEKTSVEEGSLVYALGFPMGLVEDIKVPICRLGCISRISDAFLLKNGKPTFLVDAQTFPGNSGGPIISRPEYVSICGTPANTHTYLIGILSAYLTYEDNLFSQQSGKIRMIQTENSGLTVVHPVDRIKEVVEIEWERNEIIRKEQLLEQNREEKIEVTV